MNKRIRVRVSQVFDPSKEDHFMVLEERFADMERRRPELPKGKRFRPISGMLPVHTLIWEADFSTLAEAHLAVSGLALDEEHERYASEQRPMMTSVHIEFLQLVCESGPDGFLE